MRRAIIGIAAVLMIWGCGSGGSNGTTPASTTPAAATLSAPAQNSVCITGTVVSATQSTVTFMWTAAANATNYDLYIENLLTTTTSVQSNITGTTAAVTLLQGTPYSWYLISKSSVSTATTQSATYKFYNSGPGIVTYAPFPATIVSPTYAQKISATAGAINLSWTGTSVNSGTIANYDVYFGTATTPPLYLSATANSFVNGVSVTSGSTYYWKIITRDSAGNTSDSGVYQFSVN